MRRDGRAGAAGLALVVVVALAVVALQPVRSPWTRHADADAVYAASSLNILAGERTRYLDHPGLPLQQLLAVSFGGDFLVRRATGATPSARSYVDTRLLDLDSTRAHFRAWAILFYLAGAVVSFWVGRRLLGHWTWGTAAGLLWVAAPGLAAMSIQYRPDVPLAVALLVCALLLARASERRDALLFGIAALALGVAVTVKVHAAGMLLPLAVAAVWRRPQDPWWPGLRDRCAAFLRGRRRLLAAVAAAWLVLAVVFNVVALPWGPAPSQRILVAQIVAAFAVYGAASFAAWRHPAGRAARRVFDPFLAFVAAAVLAGVALSASLAIGDGLLMLQVLKETLLGRGVNVGVEPFASVSSFADPAVVPALAVIALAVAAAAAAAARRTPWPALLALGAVVLGLMAAARGLAPYYFAPAYVVAVPAALWLVRGRAPRPVPPLAWLGVAALLVPALPSLRPSSEPESQLCRTPADRLIAPYVAAGEVGLTTEPTADTLYFGLVRAFVNYLPEYPPRLLFLAAESLATAEERGLEPRYYVGPPLERVRSAGPGEVVARGVRLVVAPLAGSDGCAVYELTEPPVPAG
jgi:hypothetical protein